MASIFDALASELGVTPRDPASPAGRHDELVERTWNGLRPDDALLDQPPQDPDWRPDGDR